MENTMQLKFILSGVAAVAELIYLVYARPLFA
jgi:hypothetical protein